MKRAALGVRNLWVVLSLPLPEPQECKRYFKHTESSKHLLLQLLITEYSTLKYYKNKDLLVFYSEDVQEWRFCLWSWDSRSSNKSAKTVDVCSKMCALTKLYTLPSQAHQWQGIQLIKISFHFSFHPLSSSQQGQLRSSGGFETSLWLLSFKAPSSGHVLNSAEAEETFLLLPLQACPGPNFHMPMLSKPADQL